MCSDKATASSLALDRIVAQARRDAEQRDKGYRERALKMYPWICGAAHASSPAPTCRN